MTLTLLMTLFSICFDRLAILGDSKFIELGTRRVHLAGWTTTPNASLVTQQARQLVWNQNDGFNEMAILIHDNDKKFSSSFDPFSVLNCECIR